MPRLSSGDRTDATKALISKTLRSWKEPVARLSEATRLQWPDVNFDDQLLTFRSTKSYEDRYVPIGDTGLLADLRWTGITRPLLANMPPVVVQKLAGHRDIKTTLRYYTEVSKADLRQAVKRMRNASGSCRSSKN